MSADPELVEPPRTAPSTLPVRPPTPISYQEREQIQTAAVRAALLLPGVVGQWLARELNSCREMGFRLDQRGLTRRLVEHLLTAPLPPQGAS